MTQIVGRESELNRIRGLLRETLEQRVLRAVRVVGSPGIGKTALLADSMKRARELGWLVIAIECHRIHSTVPLFAAKRLVRATAEALGAEVERYTSGLNLEDSAINVFDSAFYRLIEGVSLDHPLFIVVDDAHWCDEESLGLVSRAVRALADRPIILASGERMNERRQAAFDIRDEALALDELPPPDAEIVARTHFPGAGADVVAAIVARAGGRPVDIVALSQAAHDGNATSARDVDTGLRATVARQLILLDADVREFLQVCSLIGDPISLTLLSHIWANDTLSDLMARTPNGLLIQEAAGVRFVHSAIAQSVRETIPIEVPYRRRILAAIQDRPKPTVEDFEHIIEQAAACGDRELEHRTLMQMGDSAAHEAQYGLAASAWSRAAEVLPPATDEAIAFYTRLSQMYNGTNSEVDSIRVCRKALATTANAGLRDGTGALAASLIVAYWHSGHYDIAESDLNAHLTALTTPSDRAHVLSSGAYISMQRAKADRTRALISESQRLGDGVHPINIVRNHTTEAFLFSRTGDDGAALTAIKMAREGAKTLPPFVATMPMAAEIVHEFSWRGPKAVETVLERRAGEETIDHREMYQAAGFLARGEFDEVHAQATEALVRRTSVLLRRIMVNMRATAAAFRSVPASDQVWDQVRTEVASFIAQDRSSALLPIVEAWLVPLSIADSTEARTLLREVIVRRQQPLDVMVFSYPVLAVLAAKNLGERAALEQFADATSIYYDRQPWNVAQHLLARGAAASFLKRSDGVELLHESSAQFQKLGAPFFADLATRLRGEAPITEAKAERSFMGTTRREREIAALVADGLTNREIAGKLVLSERTVEGHIANLFAKVNANSRTQIAAWYLRATSSVA